MLGNINFYKKKWSMCFSAFYLYFFLTEIPIPPPPKKNNPDCKHVANGLNIDRLKLLVDKKPILISVIVIHDF